MNARNSPLAPYLRSFFEDYLVCRKRLSQNTIRSYRDAIKLLLRYASSHTGKPPTSLLVTDINSPVVLGFLKDLEDHRGNRTQTRNNRLVAIRRLFGYIAMEEPVLVDHCRQIGFIPVKKLSEIPETGYLEQHELTAILQVIDQQSRMGSRDHTLLMFMHNTGARVQEVCDARVSWLRLDPPPIVNILGKGRKWRTCPLWTQVARLLRQLVGPQHGSAADDRPIFLNRYGQPLSRFGVRNIIEKYRQRAAVSLPRLKDKRITPHTFRHTAAMHLLQAGADINVIRGWLGHVSVDTTNRYADINTDMKRKALEACEPTGVTSRRRWRPRPDILSWLESL